MIVGQWFELDCQFLETLNSHLGVWSHISEADDSWYFKVYGKPMTVGELKKKKLLGATRDQELANALVMVGFDIREAHWVACENQFLDSDVWKRKRTTVSCSV